MADDWDNYTEDAGYNVNTSSGGGSGVQDSSCYDTGSNFNKGRGFSSKYNDGPVGNGGSGYHGYDDNNDSSFNNGGGDAWNDDANNGYSNDYNNSSSNGNSGHERRGGGRGRGRGGGDRGGFRGGRGSRGGGGDRGGRRRYDENGGDYNKDDNTNGGGGGFGRGGEDGGLDEKKREHYIPQDVTEDELFEQGNTTGINFSKYDSISVNTTGENVPPPIKSFGECNLRKLVQENITRCGYTTPTPIQRYAMPIILDKRDLMACAQTGSGKTAAFLLPIINRLIEEPVDLGGNMKCEPQALIVTPTRELAIQIYQEAKKFALRSILRVEKAYGGADSRHQRNNIINGCHILVGTPGRINDFVEKRVISFNAIRFVVLDEADRMLDMGFMPQMEMILHHTSMTETNQRQTLMFSATFPEQIQRLAGQFLNNYIFVAVGIVGGACDDVEQHFYEVDQFEKRRKLLDILKEDGGSKRTLVFVETKRNTDFIATFLCENGLACTSIHGDRLQSEREQAMRDFQYGRRNILVATGVAARGLDMKDVQHVINFDLPKQIEEYVHRIGRTGRVGNRGKATSFYDRKQDGNIVSQLKVILEQAKQPIPEFMNNASGGYYENSQFGGTDFRNEDDFNGGEGGGNTGGCSNNYEEAEEEW